MHSTSLLDFNVACAETPPNEHAQLVTSSILSTRIRTAVLTDFTKILDYCASRWEDVRIEIVSLHE